MSRVLTPCWFGLPLLLLLSMVVFAEEPLREQPTTKIDFNRDIRPILSNNCFACHGPDEKERKADLRLDTREGALEGESLTVGKPEDSELIRRIISQEPSEIMPPPKTGKKISAKELQTLKEWIKQGANYSPHWAYVKPTAVAIPAAAGAGWAKNPIDHFVFRKLQQEGLSPQPEADRYTLVRRVALDLTGLPPSIAEVDEFIQDTTPNAYEKMVDRFLAKPSYGEHWARQWLDLARYADSSGYADDPPRIIWAFRDYVIRSFNQNKPFDQFTVEQLAGDLLPNPTEEQLVATAFHRNTLTNNEGGTSDEEFRNVAVVDRVNTTMAVWMGTSMACAQCHTHKYDPITQTEYFRFFAVFNNTADADRGDESPTLPVYSEEQKQQRAETEAKITAMKKRLATPTREVLAKLPTWEAKFPKQVPFSTVKPKFSAKSGSVAEIRPDGTIRIPAPKAKKDSYTVELPLDGQPLTAIRLETIPDASFPGKGAGHGGGNFVISRIEATLQPPGKPGTMARYVRIELPGQGRHLMLAEVQAFAGAENLALNKPATQSSTDFEGEPKRAVDGNTDGNYFEANSVTHTKKQDNPWWEVDLTKTATLDRIVLWNRTDGGTGSHLNNFRVTLLDEQRKTVFQQTIKESPKTSLTLPLTGGTPIEFQATADYSQPGFEASLVVSGSTNPAKNKGWAVGGAIDQPHYLNLVPAKPIVGNPGGKLVLRIEQQSSFENHLLGQFRISTTSHPEAERFVTTPANIQQILAVEAAKRTVTQREQLEAYYWSIAPETRADRRELQGLETTLANLKPITTVPIFKELEKGRVTKLQFRGSFQDLGQVVTPGTPAALHAIGKVDRIDRLAVAKWIMSPENPLTARVVANRYWESLWGNGIVRTSEEFGSQGEPPVMPELLDWLALDLQAKNWNLKAFVKQLVMSAAYRQSSRVTPEALERDPENRFASRGPRFRLPAETIRDQALAAAGLLSHKMYGPSVKPPQPNFGLSAAFGRTLDWQTSKGEDKYRRGLYTEWRRTNPYPSMSTFDAPSRESCTIRRLRSNTPLQALVTLNDPVYVEAAQALARKMAQTPGDLNAKLTLGFRSVVARPPTTLELEKLTKLFQSEQGEYAKEPAKAKQIATDPIGPAPEGLDLTELAAFTIVGNVLLNLDELFMRR